jgi:hypothetical protein
MGEKYLFDVIAASLHIVFAFQIIIAFYFFQAKKASLPNYNGLIGSRRLN